MFRKVELENRENNYLPVNNAYEVEMSLCSSILTSDCFFESTGEEFSTPSDDIWKKFGLPNNFIGYSSPFHEWTNEFQPEVRCELRHDCMWSGSCISKKHHKNFESNLTPVKDTSFSESEFDYLDSPAPSTPECDNDHLLPNTSKPPSPKTMHLDHSYGSCKRKPYSFQGLPTPSDSEEETDISLNRKNAIKLSQLSEPLRKKLQLALATILNDNATSHIIQLPTKNGNRVMKVRLQSTQQSSVLASSCRVTQQDQIKRAVNEKKKKPTFHNTLERQRRIELRIAFDKLRSLLPELSKSERAPKASILDKAVANCRSLRREHDMLLLELKRQAELNSLFKKKVNLLQSGWSNNVKKN